MKYRISLLLTMAGLCCIGGCKWDSDTYHKYVNDNDEVVRCGGCLNEDGSYSNDLDKAKCTNWRDLSIIEITPGTYLRRKTDENGQLSHVCGSYNAVMGSDSSKEINCVDVDNLVEQFEHSICQKTQTCTNLNLSEDILTICSLCKEAGKIHCDESSDCVDLSTDKANCGECGKKCDNDQVCLNGVCQAGGTNTEVKCADKEHLVCYYTISASGEKIYSSESASEDAESVCIDPNSNAHCGVTKCEDLNEAGYGCNNHQMCVDKRCEVDCDFGQKKCYHNNDKQYYSTWSEEHSISECINLQDVNTCGIKQCEDLNGENKYYQCDTNNGFACNIDGESFSCMHNSACGKGLTGESMIRCLVDNGEIKAFDQDDYSTLNKAGKCTAENPCVVCVDPASDMTCGATSCEQGALGTDCPAGKVCDKTSFTCGCPEGHVLNNGNCLDPKSNESCGATTDSPGEVCDTQVALCNYNEDSPTCSICLSGSVPCEVKDAADNIIAYCVDPKSTKYCGASSANGTCTYTTCAENEVCMGGKCECDSGFARCGDNHECVNTKNDNAHCGATGNCGMPLNGDESSLGTPGVDCKDNSVCLDGICKCNGVVCNDQCINPKNDDVHCGATDKCEGIDAGTNCLDMHPNAECNNGTCDCPQNTIPFVENGVKKCVDPQTTAKCCGNSNGACAHDCTTDPNNDMCVNGECVNGCSDTTTKCQGTCVPNDAPHVQLDDLATCGCIEGYCDSDNNLATGCEGILNDNYNCGTCGNSCVGTGKEVCRNGVCSCADGLLLCEEKCINPAEKHWKDCGVCSDGYFDGDGIDSNGCEVDLRSDVKNCGTNESNKKDCEELFRDSHVAGVYCHEGKCDYTTCENKNYGNCDGDSSKGCDISFVDNHDHCGYCGNKCDKKEICRQSNCCFPEGVEKKKNDTCCPGLVRCKKVEDWDILSMFPKYKCAPSCTGDWKSY